MLLNVLRRPFDVAQVMAAAKSKFEALKAEVQPDVDKTTQILSTVSSLQDQMTAERARLDTAESMYVDLTKGRSEYENKVNQLISEAKQAQQRQARI